MEIKSKFKTEFIFWYLFMLLCSSFILYYIGTTIYDMVWSGFSTSLLLITLFFSFILIILLIVLKDFKFIIIDKVQKHITWFSLLHPSGKRTNINDYSGFIKSTEYGSAGSYETIHLVDNSSMTRVKFNGLFYQNFEEIIDNIDLKQIKFNKHGFWEYFRLIFTGRIRIK